MSALVRVPFHGDEIECVHDERGVWVALRRMCEALGIDTDSQRKKLADKPWATTVTNAVVAEDGKPREMVCLHLDSVPMWLATIEPSRVAEGARSKLVDYQRECARVLRDHFFGRVALAPTLDAAALLPIFKAMVHDAVAGALAAVRADEDARRERNTVVGASGHRLVRVTLTEAARSLSGEKTGKRYRSIRQGLDGDLRASLGWSGAGRAWSMFPAPRFSDLRVRLDEIGRAASRVAVVPQLSLVTGGQ